MCDRWTSMVQPYTLSSCVTDRLVTDSGTWQQVRDVVLSHPVVSQADWVACDADYESLDELLWLLTLVWVSTERFDDWDEVLFASLYARVGAGLQQASGEYVMELGTWWS
jgi:hypothetical protein